MKVLVTGCQGLIGNNVCRLLYKHGYEILGLGKSSKYGNAKNNPYKTQYIDLISQYTDVIQLGSQFDPDYIIACAAIIGNREYLNKHSYDILSNNTQIDINTLNLAIELFNKQNLKKIVVLSSSIVYESLKKSPFKEIDINQSPLPTTAYGFQKYGLEYLCKAAYAQFGLPFNIVRPFNCIGVVDGAYPTKSVNVVIDLINKASLLDKLDKLPIWGSGDQLRYYTDVRDLARGIKLIIENSKHMNEDFNISSMQGILVKDLASLIWQRIHGTQVQLLHLKAPEHDVLDRSPDVSKAMKLLNFEATISIEQTIEDLIKWRNNYATN